MTLEVGKPLAEAAGEVGGAADIFEWNSEETKRIFGDYVSKYDFKRSIQDGATVPLYYENRGEVEHVRNFTSRNIKRY